MSEISPEVRSSAEQIAALCHSAQDKMAQHEKYKAGLLSSIDDIAVVLERVRVAAVKMDEPALVVATTLSSIRHRSEEIRGVRVPQPSGLNKLPTALVFFMATAAALTLGAAPHQARATHQENPMSVRDVLIGQADGLATIGEHEKATRIYRRCLSTDGPVETIASRAEVRVKMADCYLHTKQYQVAVSLCDEVIAKIPKKTSPVNKRAHTIGGLAMLAEAGDDGPRKQKALDVLFFGDEFGRRVYDKLTGAKK